ncbi:MAG TPA: HD domain-containing protein [Ruania sp.]|nr:HD domain-containing protein [Ruania sp.]
MLTTAPGGGQTTLRDLPAARLALPGTGPGYRRSLADLTDAALTELWLQATARTGAGRGVALGAVGSHGRRDAGPISDLDLVLVHDPAAADAEQLGGLAAALWYPVWDAGLELDHSVRSLVECRRVASADLVAAVSLLDLRYVAGEADLLGRARAAVLTDWRAAARRHLPDLLASVRTRASTHGELAGRLEPDLKEARGGLRDVLVCTALSASWLADRPHGHLDEAYRYLLDVRDALAATAGRRTTLLLRAHAEEVADRMGLPDADALLTEVGACGRVVTTALETTIRHARQRLRRPSPRLQPTLVRGRWRPARLPRLGAGLAEHDGEVVLAAGTDVTTDPELALRAAAVATRTGLALSPVMLTSLGRAPVPPAPWPATAREHLLTVLRCGPALLPLWHALDHAEILTRWLPEWVAVRGRAQHNPVHLYTVDHHLVQTVANLHAVPAHLPGRDLLLWAGLLHDIGKVSGAVDHSLTGARIAEQVLRRLGLSPPDRADVCTLVRHHLLLATTATRWDVRGEAAAEHVAATLRYRADLVTALGHLTEADARAAGPRAWTPWRAGLVHTLTRNALARCRYPGRST